MYSRLAPIIALFAACSDPATAADSALATCECPASEAPLSGRIVNEAVTGQAIAIGAGVSGGGCTNTKAVLLSGGCQIEEAALEQSGDIQLVGSFRGVGTSGAPDVWVCRWYNRGAIAGHATSTVSCLNPAN